MDKWFARSIALELWELPEDDERGLLLKPVSLVRNQIQVPIFRMQQSPANLWNQSPLPLLRGTKRWLARAMPISEGDFKGERAILANDYKLVFDVGKDTGVKLFDLKKDLGETNSIPKTYPEIV